MGKFIAFGNYSGGGLQHLVRINVDAIAAVETNVGNGAHTIHLIGGASFPIDAEYIKHLSGILGAESLERENSRS